MPNILKNIASSPSKQFAAMGEVPATPARRIPMQQAIAEKSISPAKLSSVNGSSIAGPSNQPPPGSIFGRAVFSRPPSDDANRSPARRIPVPAATPTMTTSRIGSPSRLMRSGSAEPQSTRPSFPNKPPSRAQSDSELSTPSKPRSTLPFPIRGHKRSQLPERIAEEGEPQPSPAKVPVVPRTEKSVLRQPSSVSSRIPRIGNKPYARPVDKGKEPHKLLQPKLKAGSSSSMVHPMRIVPAGSSNFVEGSSTAAPDTPSRVVGNTTSFIASPLKRKREPEKSSRASPPGTRPFGSSKSSVVLSPSRSSPVSRATSKEPSPVAAEPQVQVTSPLGTTTPVLPSSSRLVTPPAPSPSDIPLPSTPPDIRSSPDPISLPLPPPSPLLDGVLTGTRRSARVSKTPQPPDMDVFGSKSSQPRRRNQQSKLDLGNFPTLSVTALRAITSANTKKNQEYLVAHLETEVIRKPGERPESPTTKIKTVSERQKEEKEKGRRERAARRARRSDTGGAEEDAGSTWEGDGPSLVMGSDGKPVKHRRGAGDEGDYETPEKPERAQKKARFDDISESESSKRVKWDRGLFDTINLEDVKPQPRNRPEVVVQKGALAGSARTVRLDNLGNMLDVNSPVKGVYHESIIIKKFVYDNDEEAQPLPPPPPPPKSKGKKKART
ncbi:hypothetical protein DENSPDRAFT_98102 [Dentipellis sp. KUC8613]|nr:hypothetical protein DENSPDRAFT_98102 [Dentipellis sp. KUC8613]